MVKYSRKRLLHAEHVIMRAMSRLDMSDWCEIKRRVDYHYEETRRQEWAEAEQRSKAVMEAAFARAQADAEAKAKVS